MLAIFHVSCGILALVLGGRIFVERKGTRAHVRYGWAYATSMAGVNTSSLSLYHLTGGFNLFHLLAIMSLTMVGVGLMQVLLRERLSRWMWRHYQFMSWSYVGLLTATINEAFVRIPLFKQFTRNTTSALPLFASAAVVAASALVIFSNQNKTLARYE